MVMMMLVIGNMILLVVVVKVVMVVLVMVVPLLARYNSCGLCDRLLLMYVIVEMLLV